MRDPPNERLIEARNPRNPVSNPPYRTDDALFPPLEVDRGLVVPPLVDVAEVVELSALVVEAVGDLVADDDADAAVVQRLREVLVVERRLQDSRGEHFRGNNNS